MTEPDARRSPLRIVVPLAIAVLFIVALQRIASCQDDIDRGIAHDVGQDVGSEVQKLEHVQLPQTEGWGKR